MKLKGVKKLDKAITNLVRAYICDDIRCTFSTEFCILDNKLFYSLFQDEITDTDWVKWLKDTYGKDYHRNFSTFVLTFLHEVGHYFTIDDFDEDTANEEKANLIIDFDTDSDKEATAKRRAYWELPIEKAATDWAIDFYNSHRAEMKNFYKDLIAVIGDFYNKNLTDVYED